MNVCIYRVQRKSFLQLAIRAGWSRHLLAQTSFQLAPKTLLVAELISQFFCYSNSSKNITCPSGKLKAVFNSPIAKSTSPRLSDTTFFARWKTKWILVAVEKHRHRENGLYHDILMNSQALTIWDKNWERKWEEIIRTNNKMHIIGHRQQITILSLPKFCLPNIATHNQHLATCSVLIFVKKLNHYSLMF